MKSSHKDPSPGSTQEEGSSNAHRFANNDTSVLVGAQPNLDQADLVTNIGSGAITGGLTVISTNKAPTGLQVLAGTVAGGIVGSGQAKKHSEEEKKEYEKIDEDDF